MTRKCCNFAPQFFENHKQSLKMTKADIINVRHLIACSFHTYALEDFFYACRDLFLVPTSSAKHELKVLAYGTVGEELEVLEDDTKFTTKGWNFLPANCHHITPEYFCLFCLVNIEFGIEGA